ncbi:uncharacterized protein KIAA1143 homolog [Diaphorina citri]|uniref:Uncharacterized protein KIAA1143 homolog n=1 Tax=Diaphorina citri TaxID=121845 RepID=A0A1S4E9F6_DIACI|nr:uncharacterized protein KIAA1143 homolog [Diaphorina citri]
MSRKKHNISYIKPDEPAFLRRLKEEAGFVEGPTVDTKRQDLPVSDEEDDLDWGTVVVLKPGDLTEDQAREEKRKQEEEEKSAPADLSQKVVFKAPKRSNPESADSESKGKPVASAKKTKTIDNKKKHLLSFDQDEEEEDEG